MKRLPPGKHDTTTSYHDHHGLQIEYPEVTRCAETPPSVAAQQTIPPLALEDPSTIPTFDMTLEEAIRMAVEQSPVLRTVGETLAVPFNQPTTVFDPALASASPTQGTEAALAAFDAQLAAQLAFVQNDRPNNILGGGFTANFTRLAEVGNTAAFNGELSKQTAQGARFAVRHIVNYDRSNRPFRAFSSSYDGWLEAEWRQPLLQGSGTTYNRIAGPTNVPGQYNGVLIARVNEDVALADFETALIQLVSDVEQAYWDLTTAYRVLNAQVKGREAAQVEYQYQKSRLDAGAGSRDELAQATSQFYLFQSQVESALGGEGGLYVTEQRLRYLIGLTATDGRLIRPTTPPLDLKVVFDWQDALGQALERRVEIRRQMLQVRRREMELTAARLNMRPRLDFLAQYRWRGLGNSLLGDYSGGPFDATGAPNNSSNLYSTIASGDYQEGQAGFEFTLPVGLRAASTALAHARLNLRREQAVLAETELRVSHVLAEAARRVDLNYQLMRTNYNRFAADIEQVEVFQARKDVGTPESQFILLQSQRQVVNSASQFYRSLANYNLAIRDFHREKGSLLAYNQVLLAEGPWANGSAQAAYHVGRFLTPRISPEKVCAPRPISSGLFNPSEVQRTAPTDPAGDAAPQSLPEPNGEGTPVTEDATRGIPGESNLVGDEKSFSKQTSQAEPSNSESQPVRIAPVPTDFRELQLK